jgi:3-dehydroquinate dehydratase
MNEDALVECVAQLQQPTIEVHYGNLFAKGKTSKVPASAVHCVSCVTYRPPLQVAGACRGIVVGAKLRGYELAMEAAAAALRPEYRHLDYPNPS